MVEEMERRNFSPQSVRGYVGQISRFARHFGRCPSELNLEDIRVYQLHLIKEKKQAWSSVNQAVCALRFLYVNTLGKDWNVDAIPYAKQPRKLPLVLSKEEVKLLLDAIANHQHRLIAMTMYGTGMRISEAVSLRAANIDSKRMLIHVVAGKGRRDRVVMLPPMLLDALRQHCRSTGSKNWLFPRREVPDKHVGCRYVAKGFWSARSAIEGKPLFEVADVIRNQMDPDCTVPGLSLSNAQLRVLAAIAACRTAKLGGHVDSCSACGEVRVSYNSCRNRHCPKCQSAKRVQWLDRECSDLLPVQYFHVVFTVPAELAPLALQNKREVYGALFTAVAETLKIIGKHPRHLGASIGFIAMLHTWGQTLGHHPHIHCVIPGGGISLDGTRWIPCRTDFFLPVRVLSRLYRGKLLAALTAARAAGRLEFHGKLRGLSSPKQFACLFKSLRSKEWVVYAKPPFGDPAQVLKYLARYTHHVAIANSRIVNVTNDTVTFRYKNYAQGGRSRVMTLSSLEFLRRFAQHVLPRRFVRIRHLGFLANRARKDKLSLCRKLLQVTPQQVEAR